MTALLEQYTSVYTALEQIEGELIQVGQVADAMQEMHNFRIAQTNAALQEKLEEISQHIARVNAFIGIAKTHTTRLIPSPVLEPYDNGLLSRLAVQVNSTIADDPYATQLYTHATGQLNYLTVEQNRLHQEYEGQLKQSVHSLSAYQGELGLRTQQAESSAQEYLSQKEFTELIAALEQDTKVFSGAQSTDRLPQDCCGTISLGTVKLPLPVPPRLRGALEKTTHGLYDAASSTIQIPVSIPAAAGRVLIVEYENENESTVLSGIQNLILNIVRYYSSQYSRVFFADPLRYNASSLGCLAGLCRGAGSVIDPVPTSQDELRSKLRSITAELNARELRQSDTGPQSGALYVFHSFPRSYDTSLAALIQQLCINAEHYGITVILTNNISAKGFGGNDTLDLLRTTAVTIGSATCFDSAQKQPAPFQWYAAPQELPISLVKRCIDAKPAFDLDNDYLRRVGLLECPDYRKGTRMLENIPYGIDAQGELKTLDFENSNFATFICGAARSGKSTLLHALITGFIQNSHPDDIELWLIDFKMTEFSRYIDHMPPHVRYILLDESPELVYDILDRLTEILLKRQNMFKGKWQKLSDVPADKYMPEIMVIIDEFSVMSQIVADSAVSGKENYVIKLQALLAKGAALGLRFIFASQGFTSGTRGLNDFSKQQVQQRIAMKAYYNEIRETLDVKSASDGDKVLMEQLPVHHALTRVPADENGNHVCMAKVLNISDHSAQEQMIDMLCSSIAPVARYDPDNIGGYIDKKPLVVDGGAYKAFDARMGEMKSYLRSHHASLSDGSEFVVFLGEPKRMLPIYPIHIANEFCENMLLIAPSSEKMPASSVILSAAESLALQGQEIQIWSGRKDPLYQQIKFGCQKGYAEKIGLEAICQAIREIKTAIQHRTETNCFFVLSGVESILIDMSFQESISASDDAVGLQPTYEKRAPGAPDLMSQLMSAMGEYASAGPEQRTAPKSSAPIAAAPVSAAYDARADLKYILTNGPRLGYHFILHFTSPGDVEQSKLDPSLFKHKITFRAAKADISLIIGAGNAAVVSELEAHIFRYTNGLDSVSFRPYLHPDLFWDGWTLVDGEAVQTINEEDEYLL